MPAPRLEPLVACIGLALALGGGVASGTGTASGPGAPTRAALPPDVIGIRGAHASRTGTTHVVTNCEDSGPGSLREAVEVLATDGDSIDLSGLACSTITLTSGAITNTHNGLYLVGPGADRLTIDGGAGSGATEPVFTALMSTTSLSLSYLTVANANHTGADVSGGCIYTRGDLLLVHAVVTGCSLVNSSVNGSVTARGGGVYVMGNLTAKYSTISDNEVVSVGSDAEAGGVFVAGDLFAKYSTISGNSVDGNGSGTGGGLSTRGEVAITGSTISGNHAAIGMGAMSLSGTGVSAVITNSTISGNSTDGFVGGIYVGIPLTLQNSTVAFNDAAKYTESGYSFASGLLVNGAPADLQSSIIAGNVAEGQPADLQLAGASLTGADNLVFAPGSAAVPADTLVGQDPQLAPLAWNSSRHARSHAPAAGSPVIDAGNNAADRSYDQRGSGFPRVVGANADIGAIELDPERIFTDGFD
jgi:hypothetical protein